MGVNLGVINLSWTEPQRGDVLCSKSSPILWASHPRTTQETNALIPLEISCCEVIVFHTGIKLYAVDF